MFHKGKFLAATCGRSAILVLCWLVSLCGPVRGGEGGPSYELPMPNSGNIQPSLDQIAASRVLDFLQFKQQTSLPTLLKDNNDDLPHAPELAKRVFCNGFTGCKGRFRNRRVQQQPTAELNKRSTTISKRPFCNTYGCYNSGRKRSSQTIMDTPEAAGQKVTTFDDGLLQWNRIKKLFCNGYGGCQNLGKRLSVMSDDVAREINNQHPHSFPFAKSASGSFDGRKRFFTSSAEDDFDSLIR